MPVKYRTSPKIGELRYSVLISTNNYEQLLLSVDNWKLEVET